MKWEFVEDWISNKKEIDANEEELFIFGVEFEKKRNELFQKLKGIFF